MKIKYLTDEEKELIDMIEFYRNKVESIGEPDKMPEHIKAMVRKMDNVILVVMNRAERRFLHEIEGNEPVECLKPVLDSTSEPVIKDEKPLKYIQKMIYASSRRNKGETKTMSITKEEFVDFDANTKGYKEIRKAERESRRIIKRANSEMAKIVNEFKDQLLQTKYMEMPSWDTDQQIQQN